jgi:exonuclease VII large subunit
MPLTAHLTQLSPLKILDRGYAIIEREGPGERKIVKSPADVPPNSEIQVRVSEGRFKARVTSRHTVQCSYTLYSDGGRSSNSH